MSVGLVSRFGCVMAAVWLGVSAQAELRLPAVFAEHMVLQGGREVPCWGWADPGVTVNVTFTDTKTSTAFSAKALTTAEGRWQVVLPVMPAGSAGTLKIQAGGTDNRVIEDVLVGEVWLASGQSNMTYRVGAPDFPEHVAELAKKEAASLSGGIRIFTVIQEGTDTPRGDVRGKWVVVDENTVTNCSAVPWNFAQGLHRELKQPVGVIVSGYGGTPVESWLSREALAATSSAEAVWKRHEELLAKYPEAKKTYDEGLTAWEQANPTADLQKLNSNKKPRAPYSAESSKAPTRLFNAMIDGLVPYAIQGVVWYQGEENSGRPQEYAPLIRGLITSWRARWGVEWPFYYVELANTRSPQTKPSEGGWALIREAQGAALALPKTGVVTAVDLGDGRIHPWNKKAVGERLVALAMADVHGRVPAEVRSPEYVSHVIEGAVVRLQFDHAGGLRVRGDQGIRGFAIAGSDGVWRWADAKITGEQIEVSSPEVAVPIAVRYGWASNPVLSIENEAGLPLRPFRTDREIQ